MTTAPSRPTTGLRRAGAIAARLLAAAVFLLVAGRVRAADETPAATNRVLELDGRRGYVELPAGAFDGARDFTIEFWVHRTTPNESEVVSDCAIDFVLDGERCSCELRPDFVLIAVNSDGNSRTLGLRVPQALSPDRWNHFAFVREARVLRIFRNGQPLAEGGEQWRNPLRRMPAENFLGRERWWAAFGIESRGLFRGRMDEVRFWDRARPAEEIRRDLGRRLTGSEPGLRGLWNFDGGDARDASPRGAHGRLVAASTVAEELPPPPAELIVTRIRALSYDSGGNPLPRTRLQAIAGDQVIGETTDPWLFLTNPPARLDLRATHESGRGGRWNGTQITPGSVTNLSLTLSRIPRLAGTLRALDGVTPITDALVELVEPVNATGSARVGGSVPGTGPTALARDVSAVSLDGTNACVEIPAQLDGELGHLTIEGWVRWRRFQFFSRFFDFGKEYSALYLLNQGETNRLWLASESLDGRDFVGSGPVLEPDRWIHLAAVAGTSGMKLYVNGVLAAENSATNALQVLRGERRFFLGRSNWHHVLVDPDLAGDLAEVSFWNIERTAEQIRSDLAGPLKGGEPGLLGYWDFRDVRDGVVPDRSPSRRHGRLVGNARVIPARLPVVVTGRVREEAGGAVSDAALTVTDAAGGGRTFRSNASGDYALTLEPGVPVDLRVESGVLASYRLGFLATAEPVQSLDWVVADTERSDVTAASGFPGGRVLHWDMTDGRGAFQFGDLPPGAYQLRVQIPGGRHWLARGEVQYLTAGTAEERLQEMAAQEFQLAPFVKGQWRHFSFGDGLTEHEVSGLAADGQGMLWVDAAREMLKFDGRTFERAALPSGFGDWSLLPSSRAPDGSVWFRGTNAVCRWDPRSGTSRVVTEPAEILAGGPIGFSHEAGGVTWILTTKGAARDDGKEGRVAERWSSLPVEPRGLLRSSRGEFWLTTWKSGIFRWDGRRFVDRMGPEDPRRSVLGVLAEHPLGTLWFAGNGGAWRVRDDEITHPIAVEHRDDARFDFFSHASSPGGVGWFGSRTGPVYREDGRSLIKVPLGKQPEDGGVHTSALVWSDEDQLWAGTRFGLWRYDPDSVVNYSSEDGLPAPEIRALRAGKDGSLWIGTGRGLARFDGRKFRRFGTEDGLPPGGILGLEWVSPTEVWIGTGQGLVRYDGQGFTSIPAGPQTYPSRFVRSLSKAPDGALWFACGQDGWWDPQALVRLDGTGFRSFTTADGLPNNYVYDVRCAPDGAVWCVTSPGAVGSRQGVSLVRWDGKGFQPFDSTEGVTGSMTAFGWESPDRIWLGTTDGLLRWNPRAARRESIPASPPPGLISLNSGGFNRHSSDAIFHDSRGWAWFATLAGAFAFDGTNWTSIDSRDGLPSNPVRTIQETADGSLWFGTDEGLSRYRVRKRALDAPRLELTVDRHYARPGEAPTFTTGRRFVFEANVVDLRTAPEKRQYRWRVQPAAGPAPAPEAGWSEARREPTFEWTPPGPGSFSVAVQYLDRDLNYSLPAVFPVAVALPWYLDPWIAGPAVLANAVLFGVAAVSSARSRRRKREADQLREQLLLKERSARQSAEEAREAAQAASTAKSQFLANVSHELRTPLNAIIGYSEMLKEEAPAAGVEEMIPDLDRIHSAARHQLGLINDLLDFSKIEAGKMDLEFDDVDVAKLVGDVAATVRPLVARKGNRLEVDCASGLGAIRTDATRLTQVLFNLISNAAKFTEKGEIRLAVTRRPAEPAIGTPDRLEFRVTDTGIGMTPEQLGRLFQAFSQADATIARKYGGTGLGLALSRRICQMLGGDIAVESEAGRGSTFTVTLPGAAG